MIFIRKLWNRGIAAIVVTLTVAAAVFGLWYLLAAGKVSQPAFPNEPGAAGTTEYIFGIHPLQDPERVSATYGPITDYLTTRIPGVRFRLDTSHSYEEFEKKLYGRAFHFAMPNPYQTLRSEKYGYRIFGKMGDDFNFRGIILVRSDSGIENVTDLKGKRVSYPSLTALAATMMPQYYLHTHGLDVNRDIVNLYVGSQESSIMYVFHGLTAAGSTWPVPWLIFQERHPEMAKELVAKWQTGTLPNNGLVVRDDVPPALTAQVAAVLFSLQDSEAGRNLLKPLQLSRFEPATPDTFEPVRAYINRFSTEVRPVSE